MRPIPQRIAEELSVRPEQVIATIEMINEGSTVPFIARYRNCLLYTSPSPRDRG